MRAEAWLLYDGSSYEVRARVYNDNASSNWTNRYDITDAEHYVEVLVTYASGATANDGAPKAGFSSILRVIVCRRMCGA